MVVTQAIKDVQPVHGVVLNAAGQQVQKVELNFTDGKVKLNLRNVTAGVYLLLLTDSKGDSYTLKFTVF